MLPHTLHEPSSLPALVLALLPFNDGELALVPTSPPPVLRPAPLPRNHGPGTSGGGSSTPSGETLRAGRWQVTVRTDFTEFEHIGVAGAEARALRNGAFDAVDRTFLETVSIAYGLTDDLQITLSTGYYAGVNFVDAEDDGMGGIESSTADPDGRTDLWLSAKWRLYHGRGGRLAVSGGVKFPTGKDDVTLANGELLEGSSQPGSGAFDYRLGLGYSRFLTPRVTLDAGGSYTFRTRHDGFAVGDRADLGAALAYRLTEDVRAPWNWSVFGEVSGVWLGKDRDDLETNESSGGTFLYASIGARLRVDEHLSITLAPALPIVQDLNGLQNEVDARAALSLTYTP